MTISPTIRRWLLLLGAFVPLSVLWALVNPMFASPDEPAHMVRAQGFSRGDLVAPYVTDGLPVDANVCYRFQSQVTADCADLTWGEAGTAVDVPTDGYPPTFHALAALPATVSSGLSGAYLMRLWMALVCAVLLAWAGSLVARPGVGPWPFVGLVLAVTPMVTFTASTVNPSGITAALTAVLVAGVLGRWHHGWADRSTLVAIVVGAVGLATVRRDGLLWLAIVAVALLPVLPLGRLRAGFVRRRRLALALGVAAVIVAAGLWWAAPTIDRFVLNGEVGGDGSRWQGIGVLRIYLYQVVGQFGWLDAPIGDEAFIAAMVAAGTLVLVALASGPSRLVAVTGVSVAAFFIAPVVFGAVRYPYLQGRYLFPIWVCSMIAAGAAVSAGGLSARVTARLSRLLVAIWLIVHLVGYAQNLRRYAVGRYGTWWFLRDAPWHPPTMSNLVAMVAVVPVLVVAAWAVLVLARDTARPTD